MNNKLMMTFVICLSSIITADAIEKNKINKIINTCYNESIDKDKEIIKILKNNNKDEVIEYLLNELISIENIETREEQIKDNKKLEYIYKEKSKITNISKILSLYGKYSFNIVKKNIEKYKLDKNNVIKNIIIYLYHDISSIESLEMMSELSKEKSIREFVCRKIGIKINTYSNEKYNKEPKTDEEYREWLLWYNKVNKKEIEKNLKTIYDKEIHTLGL